MGRSKGKRKPKRGHAKGNAQESSSNPTTAAEDAAGRPHRLKPSMTKEERIQNRKAKRKTAETYSIQQLLDKVEEYMDSFDYELAHTFCKRALELDPDNVSVLETLGNLLVERGNIDGAKKCFGRAITVCPDTGFNKYMFLGQLFEGKEAIDCFQKGVEIMIEERHKSQSEGASAVVETSVSESDISSAYCSMAEIYLTDACFEEDAEEKCKECLDKAIEHDPSNTEAFQLLSSYWLSMDNKEQAKEAIQKSVSLWLPAFQHAEEEEGEEEEGMASEPISSCPVPYQTRLSTAKILIELEELDTADDVLESLMQEDDEVVQVLYMMGLVNEFRKTDECKAPARYFLNTAKRLYGRMDCDDAPVLEHIEELLKELGPGEGDAEDWLVKKAMELNQDEGDEDDELTGQEEGEEEDGWSSEEDEDEEEMEH